MSYGEAFGVAVAGISPAFLLAKQFQPERKTMSLIRYQTPNLSPWQSLDRWSNLREELNSLFDGPGWPDTMRQAQLFTGWTPALDLYQTNDDVVAVVAVSGMRK